MIVDYSDLVIAYRKAKVDLYYSTNPSLLAIAAYEENLEANLKSLEKRINGKATNWVAEPKFLGSWNLAPKSIRFPDRAETSDKGLIHASPEEEWASKLNEEQKPIAEFRLMAHCSLDFHVFSALWMLKVGDLFDGKLSNNVYGSRLRRNKHNKINELSLGSFKPYLKPFRDWRDGGIKAMSTALAEKKKVLALTADVTSFYHELNPSFMLNAEFHERVGIELNTVQSKLNKLFIKALGSWSKNTPLKKGLPVGLPASAVVANAALIELDQFVERQVIPLYYGRYVDDILLVMENTSDIRSVSEFWRWVFSRDGGTSILGKEPEDSEDYKSVLFKPDYLKDCRIAFESDKNKLFVLSGGPGKALVDAIIEQINQRASEWRALPDLPDLPGNIASDLVKASNRDGEKADNLRKTDDISLNRAGFALTLRDYEAYERDLPPEAWQAHRHAFFDAIIDHMLTPVKFFELAQYLPRVVRMATICEDFVHLAKMLKRLKGLVGAVSNDCKHLIKASTLSPKEASDHIGRWKASLGIQLTENIIAALPVRPSRQGKIDWEQAVRSEWDEIGYSILIAGLNKEIQANGLPDFMLTSMSDLQRHQARLFSHDLAHTPLRFSGLPKEMVSQIGIPARSKIMQASWKTVDHELLDYAIPMLAGWFKPKLPNGVPPGLYFATRPFSLNELYLLTPTPFDPSQHEPLSSVVCALRGFELSEHKMPQWDKDGRVLRVPDGEPISKQTIAVASWKTENPSFVAAVKRLPDPDSRKRYQRLNRLTNDLIARPDNSGYVIFPEVSIPPQWFMRIADKLKGRGISLIAGVEYLHASKKQVRNQIWAALTHDGLGFPSLMLYRQDKQTPAFHEEKELFRLSGLQLKPAKEWKLPPIIQHGSFYFAMLICSELTNIRYRSDLRGKIDALFVPEWNSDTETFNALVESAALDIHAYIVQCNNRQYGDSRIRAPYKDRWKRDLLRVKGGNHDYCITGEIDVRALRQFQSSHRSPSKEFKPVPDGFNQDMAHSRKVLPEGE